MKKARISIKAESSLPRAVYSSLNIAERVRNLLENLWFLALVDAALIALVLLLMVGGFA